MDRLRKTTACLHIRTYLQACSCLASGSFSLVYRAIALEHIHVLALWVHDQGCPHYSFPLSTGKHHGCLFSHSYGILATCYCSYIECRQPAVRMVSYIILGLCTAFCTQVGWLDHS